MYAKKYSIATNLMLNRMSTNLSRQVRSVMTDKYGGLWFGTKGDGLLHVPDYHQATRNTPLGATVYSPGKKQVVSSYIKWNQEFHAYKLVQSRYMDGFWIGAGDPGLFYYSFRMMLCIRWNILPVANLLLKYMIFMKKVIAYYML